MSNRNTNALYKIVLAVLLVWAIGVTLGVMVM